MPRCGPKAQRKGKRALFMLHLFSATRCAVRIAQAQLCQRIDHSLLHLHKADKIQNSTKCNCAVESTGSLRVSAVKEQNHRSYTVGSDASGADSSYFIHKHLRLHHRTNNGNADSMLDLFFHSTGALFRL